MSTSPDATSLNLSSLARTRRSTSLGTAPNLLTLLRIGLVPVLILAVLEHRYRLAFELFLVAASTDALDGLLARLLHQRTQLGEYLDPLADKLLVGSLFLVLTHAGVLEPYITVMVFGRDLGMLVSAWIVHTVIRLRDFRPTLLGKANSLSQMLAIGAVLLGLISRQAWVSPTRAALLDATVFLTVLSGFHYALVISRRIGLAVPEKCPQSGEPVS